MSVERATRTLSLMLLVLAVLVRCAAAFAPGRPRARRYRPEATAGCGTFLSPRHPFGDQPCATPYMSWVLLCCPRPLVSPFPTVKIGRRRELPPERENNNSALRFLNFSHQLPRSTLIVRKLHGGNPATATIISLVYSDRQEVIFSRLLTTNPDHGQLAMPKLVLPCGAATGMLTLWMFASIVRSSPRYSIPWTDRGVRMSSHVVSGIVCGACGQQYGREDEARSILSTWEIMTLASPVHAA